MLSLFAAVFTGLVTAFLFGAALLVVVQHSILGFFVAAVGCFCAGLSHYVWRDFRGKWGLRVVLDREAVTLDLPAGRSLIHRVPAQRLTIPYADIAAVETRLEAYRSFGMANMQRAYALRRKSGQWIFLFEDRALATQFETSFFADIAEKLAARAGVVVHDLGMVEGCGGFLVVWGTHAQDWAAPSLPADRQARLWRGVVITGQLAAVSTAIVFLLWILQTIFR
ncbi:MAG: hypothetical protein U1E81_17615 [Xanthobacteraceae bacterium]